MQLTQAKSIILQEKTEWSKILQEESTKNSLIKYGFMLIIISHVCAMLGSYLFASSVSFGLLRFSLTYYLASYVIQAVLGLLAMYIVPVILAKLAPSFGGQANDNSALKLYVFTMTPVWVGMIFNIIPVLGWLIALVGAIYGLYLLWEHIGEAMGVSDDKKLGYTIVSIIVVAVVYFVIGAIGTSIASALFVTTVFHSTF